MPILSWLRAKKRFMRRSAVDEFSDFAQSEADRLRHSDQPFDADLHQQATELVLGKLKFRHRKG